MNYNLTITPKPEGNKDFKYILSITNTSQSILGSRSTHYGTIDELELALLRAGWPELMKMARKQLKLGLQFTSMMDISDDQVGIMLNR